MENKGRGVSLITLLGVILVVLKALNFISLAWLWVLAPFWIPIAFIVLLLIIAIVVKIVDVLKKQS